MPKFQLLLLDTGVVIELHRRGLWQDFMGRCSVHLTDRVVEEVRYWEKTDDAPGQGGNTIKISIDLGPDIQTGRIICHEVPLGSVDRFLQKFDPVYRDQLHGGELASLALLCAAQEDWRISSADAAVFRVLGRLGRGQQGVSLEEILQQIGMGRELDWKFSTRFRLKYTRAGESDSITGPPLR